MEEAGRAAAVGAFMDRLPYARALAMAVEALGGGEATIAMPWNAALVGDPATGVIHGGAVSALMDTAGGAAAMTMPGTLGTATLDLRIDYMRPAAPGATIRARATCYHVTRHVAFVRAVASDGDDAHPVATAAGAFTIERAP
ncbi:MAG: PaaI family thioesterase [Rhodobacteraceae bacterium]|nr:PaaI family thioesterase [Paracoccaceae bacterium]